MDGTLIIRRNAHARDRIGLGPWCYGISAAMVVLVGVIVRMAMKHFRNRHLDKSKLRAKSFASFS
jgi:hypothetical protein